MPKRLTTQDWISKARKIHGDKYDYSQSEYKSARENITIICPIHGPFEQKSYSHLNGKGCYKCGRIQAGDKQKMSKEEFIERSGQIHGNKYDYSLVEYKNARTPVKIICPEHGIFEQTPHEHISGSGCVKCYWNKRSLELRDTKEEFVEKSNKVHNNKYNYDKVNYINNSTKVIITCPIHGDFEQTPAHHKGGQGCPKCGNLRKFSNKFRNSLISKGEKVIIEWLDKHLICYQYDLPIEIYSNFLVRVDFVIGNIYIEYNGIQHYERNPYFHKTELDFLKQQYRDSQLRKYCKENNITLLEIRYDENIEEKLEEIKPLLLLNENE